MLQALRTALSSDPQKAALPASPVPQKTGLLLLEEIICGTHYALLNTAAIGSAFNVMRNKGRLQRSSQLRNVIPHPPSGRSSWGRLMQEMQQPDTVSAPVASYLAHLAVVEKQVEFICDEIDAQGVAPALVQHSARLGQAARQMSDLGLGALNALEKITSIALTSYYMRNMVLLRGLLRDVAGGASPLIDRNGRIFLPELPQRRAPVRKLVNLPCVVECKGKESRAVVSNVNAGGFGLIGAPNLSPRSVVVIEVAGRCLSGTAVWVSGTSAGIKFDQILKDDDPLLA